MYYDGLQERYTGYTPEVYLPKNYFGVYENIKGKKRKVLVGNDIVNVRPKYREHEIVISIQRFRLVDMKQYLYKYI